MTSLVVVAGWLLVAALAGAEPLKADQAKNVWTFLGVALGAAVTLLGTLLTAQHQRRSTELARQVAADEARARGTEARARSTEVVLAAQAERRLQVEGAAKMLEFLTDGNGAYARRAVVAGAITSMMEVAGGTAGVRVLRELWQVGAVPSSTAVAVINRVLEAADKAPSGEDSAAGRLDNSLQRPLRPPELYAAAELLAINAHKVLPPSGSQAQIWVNWPSLFTDEQGREHWPRALPAEAKYALLVFVAMLLVSREVEWWKQTGAVQPIGTLVTATGDEEVVEIAARLLVELEDLGFLREVSYEWADPAAEVEYLRAKAGELSPMPWFVRLLDRVRAWGHGEEPPGVVAAPVTWRQEDTERWLSVADQRERGLEPVLRVLVEAAGLVPGEHVLDVGCGTGPTTRAAALAVRPGGTVTGLDLAPELVEEAARRVQEPEVRWLAGDATTVELPAAHFDAVVSRFGVMFFADPVAAFANLAGATRPGGRLAVAVWPASHEVEQFALPAEAARRALAQAGVEAAEPDPHRGPFSLGREEEVRSLLDAAGWSDVEVRVEEPLLPLAQPGDDLASVAREMLGTADAGALLEGAPDEVVDAAVRDLEAQLTERVTADGVRLAGRVHLVLAVRRHTS